MLQLQSLSIERTLWGEHKGLFQGKIKYAGERGEVAVVLSPKDCERLFPVIAEAIVSASREVAEQLTKEALASMPSEELKIA